MAENIFEELVEEIERILGGHFKIGVKAEGCDFCFEDLKRERTRKAFQKTVTFVMKNTQLRKFSFKEEEIGNLTSLASVFLNLVCSGMNSLQCNGQFNDQRHFLECIGCQMTLIKTAEHFTMQLIFEKEKNWLTVIKKAFQNFFKKIFGFRKKTAGCEKINIAALLADFQASLFSLLAFSMLISSKEKWEIIQKYFPLFKKREIEPEKVIIALTKATEKKRENLTTEEFEKTLRELLELKRMDLPI